MNIFVYFAARGSDSLLVVDQCVSTTLDIHW